MSVTNPPSMEPNDRGINTVAGDRPAFVVDCIAMGINRARAPTLFMNIERKAARNVSMEICSSGLEEKGSINCVINSTAPDLVRPKLTINTSTTVIVAGLPKPENNSACGTTPNMLAVNKAPSATIS